jgi:hypothetical protein
MRTKSRRPSLRVEIEPLGSVDPFTLRVVEDPPGSGRWYAGAPAGERMPLGLAGMNVVGASHALLTLSRRWVMESGGPDTGLPGPPEGEVTVALRLRETRLLESLLRRHLRRLPQAPPWMPELAAALREMAVLLRWEG